MRGTRLLIVAFVLAVPVASSAQLDPATYSVSHLLTLIQGPSPAEAGRGGAGVAVAEPWGYNPAVMPKLAAEAQLHLYNFDNGLQARFATARAAYALKRWGFVVTGGELSSTKGDLPIPGLKLDMHESDLSVVVCNQVTDRFSVGLAMAPRMNINMHITSPAGQVAELHSSPKGGFCLGGLWDVGCNWSLGGTYENYLESVTLDGPMVTQPFVGSYRSEIGHYGVAKRTGRWLFAADRIKGRLFGAPSTIKVDNWLYGADYQLSPQWTFRAGTFDRQPSGGVSYHSGHLTANYAHMKNYADNELHQLLGGSATDAVNVSYEW